MTRSFYPANAKTWGMFCDSGSCETVIGPRARQQDLPLREFADAGWFVAKTWGDRCPACVAKGDVPNVQRWRGESA